MAKKLAILSPSTKGISADLRLIKNQLSKSIDDIEFSYFTNNENLDSKEESKVIRMIKVDFCEKAENILCIDATLPVRDMFEGKDYNRILIPICYDYLFKRLYEDEKKNTISNYTHILYTSPLAKQIIESKYCTDGIEAIDGYCSPLSFDICNKESQRAVLDRLTRFYPSIADKKIVSIVKTGNCKASFDSFDLSSFLNELPSDSAVLTNVNEILPMAHYLNDEEKDRFYFLDTIMAPQDYLYISNAVITNNSYLACSFATKEMPIYSLEYNNNFFEKYMADNTNYIFPRDYINIAEEISKGSFDTSICKLFSNPADKCVNEILPSLIK